MKQESIKLIDQNGNAVHAHGGQIIEFNGYYYFLGEDRTGRNKVSCYRSKNLVDWEFRNNVLTLDSKTQEHPHMITDLTLEVEGQYAHIGTGCNIERPKIIHNEKTGQFVMWMHWEMPDDYGEARCAVAVCDSIDGNYTYLGSFNPMGYMSRDCTLFKDDDGTAYFISAARNNEDLHIYSLNEDYLTIDTLERKLWPGQMREAPTVFKKDGLYYMLTSACTGWSANQSSYAYSESFLGKWSARKNFGDETTFVSQPTWVIPVRPVQNGGADVEYIYLGDRWGGRDAYFESEYVFNTICFNGKEIYIEPNNCKLYNIYLNKKACE